MLDPDVWALPTFGASSDQDSGDKPDCSSSSSSGASAKQQKPQKAGQARSGQQQQQQGGGNRQVSGTYSRQQEALVYFPDEGKAVQVRGAEARRTCHTLLNKGLTTAVNSTCVPLFDPAHSM
jgi:hypothetical protein